MRGRIFSGLMIAFAVSAGTVEAQEWSEDGKVKWISNEDEVRLARTAAPWEVSSAATVYVVGKWGYEVASEGNNGFSCYVDRGWSGKDILPKCSDWSGTRSHFAMIQKREQLRTQGKSQADAQSAIAWGLMDGSIQAPRAGSITYMMSEAGVSTGENGEEWAVSPRVLVHTPYARHSALGLDEEAGKKARWSGGPFLDLAGGPLTSIVIPMKSRESNSDGGED